jgi:Ser/Thr protein kinase RdoA (MazF antagonist)
VAALATNIDAALAALPPAPAAPLRIVHGDPKLSNLLFAVDGAPLCLVDLDTLAHAPLAYELGDAFRSWCNPHAEDATQATFDLGLFEGAARGYAEEMSASITIPERDAIVIATQAICLELAARFAADALREAYFGWDPSRFASRGEHNLARARGQWQLAVAVGSQRNAAEAIVRDVFST